MVFTAITTADWEITQKFSCSKNNLAFFKKNYMSCIKNIYFEKHLSEPNLSSKWAGAVTCPTLVMTLARTSPQILCNILHTVVNVQGHFRWQIFCQRCSLKSSKFVNHSSKAKTAQSLQILKRWWPYRTECFLKNAWIISKEFAS